jgi:uncharacterized surface protein with fasciclin (FAS1) repeats
LIQARDSSRFFRYRTLTSCLLVYFHSCGFLVDIICSSEDTKTFCEIATKAAKTNTTFADGLEGGKSYTVFAPTDEAFKNFEKELLQLKPDELHRTLLFHFYEDVLMTYEDMGCSSKLTSLTSDMSRTKCQRITAGVYMKYQRGRGNKDIGVYPLLDTQSKEACSGIIHSINNVLLPIVFKPFKSMIIEDDEDFDEDFSEEDDIIINEEDTTKDEEVVEEEKPVEEEVVEEEKPVEEEVVEEEKPVEEEVVEEEKPVDEENNDVLIIDGPISSVEWGDTVKPEETLIESDQDDKAPVGSDKDATGTLIGTPSAVEEVGDDEAKGPRIGALGINLIIFSTLLLCFVFVCMRR